MKNFATWSVTVVFIGITIAACLLTRKAVVDADASVLKDVSFFFKEATLQDYNVRLKNTNLHVFLYYSVEQDWPREQITVATKQGERTLTNIDSIRALSMEQKIRILGETNILRENPVNPDSLNACIQRILHDRNISVSTGIRYTEVENDNTFYSGTDTLFFATAHPMEEYRTGLFNEIAVQMYVKIPFSTRVKRVDLNLVIPVIGWLSFLILYIVCVNLFLQRAKIRKEKTVLSRSDPRKLIRIDKAKNLLSYNDQTIELPPNLTQLVVLFLDKPDYFLTQKEIIDELWKGVDVSQNRISQTMSRLRTALEPIPELRIENVRGVGFRIVFFDFIASESMQPSSFS